jgi:hypothetical protein
MSKHRFRNHIAPLLKARDVREGWDAAFAHMAGVGDDAPLIPDAVESDFDKEEWT